MPSKSQKPRTKSRKKTLLFVLLGIVLLIAVGCLIFILVQKSRIAKAEADNASNASEAFEANSKGIASKAPEDLSDPWWQNPSNVAVYVADWCGKGHPYEYTSKGCRYVQDNAGENKISPEQWDVKLAELAESSGQGLSATTISTIASAMADAVIAKAPITGSGRYRRCSGTQAVIDGDYLNKSSSELNTLWRAGLVTEAKKILDREIHSYSQGRSYCQRVLDSPKAQKTDLTNSHTGLFYLSTSAMFRDDTASARAAITDAFYTALRDGLSKKAFVDVLRESVTPESKGYVIVYNSGPEYEACIARQAQESADCVERVQSLISSGTVATLTELNAQMAVSGANE